MKSKMIKLLSILPITIAANVSANNFADVKLTHIKPEKSGAQWIRTKQFTPMYPVDLAMTGITDCGLFTVIIDTNGKTDILVFRYNGAVWQEVGRTLNLSES